MTVSTAMNTAIRLRYPWAIHAPDIASPHRPRCPAAMNSSSGTTCRSATLARFQARGRQLGCWLYRPAAHVSARAIWSAVTAVSLRGRYVPAMTTRTTIGILPVPGRTCGSGSLTCRQLSAPGLAARSLRLPSMPIRLTGGGRSRRSMHARRPPADGRRTCGTRPADHGALNKPVRKVTVTATISSLAIGATAISPLPAISVGRPLTASGEIGDDHRR